MTVPVLRLCSCPHLGVKQMRLAVDGDAKVQVPGQACCTRQALHQLWAD